MSTLCFSGHRSYPGTPDEACRLAGAVAEAYADGFRTFISGVAMGFDLAAAEAVLRLRAMHPDVRLVCAVPFARQAAAYPSEDLARYRAVLAAADETCVLAEGYSHGCYHRRNEWMVGRSGRIICYYNNYNSGTRYTVKKALAAGLEIVNLHRAAADLFNS